MRRSTTIIASLVILSAAAPHASAQLIQVAPGYVKAPFVRVYSYPDGSSYVRAPLVRVGSPGYYRHGGYGNEADLAAMDWRNLALAVRDYTGRLNVDLNRSSSGEFWKGNLKTADILKVVPGTTNEPPADEARRQLRPILATFDTVASSSDLNGVANYSSFRALRAALQEYLLPPAVHVGRQLRAYGSELHQALRQFETGDTWQKYLLVEPDMALSARQRDAAAPLPDLATAQDALVRFDTVRDTAEYAPIADVPEFQSTREILVNYIKLVQIPAPPTEELPTPPKKQ